MEREGDDDDDILIDGRTAYDRDVASLMAIMEQDPTPVMSNGGALSLWEPMTPLSMRLTMSR
jgi:hypothetical protein